MTTAEFRISTVRRTQFVSMTSKVAAIIADNNWKDGALRVRAFIK